MKIAIKSLVVLVLAGVLMTYAGCGSKKPTVVPVTDTQIDALSKNSWVVHSTAPANTVTRDSDDKTSDYSAGSFTIIFSGTHGQQTINYTTTGRPALSPWPASGTFTFDAAAPTTSLNRNDTGGATVPFTYLVSGTTLKLSFQYTGLGFPNSRTDEVTGLWVFNLTPQ